MYKISLADNLGINIKMGKSLFLILNFFLYLCLILMGCSKTDNSSSNSNSSNTKIQVIQRHVIHMNLKITLVLKNWILKVSQNII